MTVILVPASVTAAFGNPPEPKGLQAVTPDTVGFSAERLRRFDVAMRRMVEDKEFAGLVTLGARCRCIGEGRIG